MAEFIRLTAVEADTELREIRTALLKQLTQLDNDKKDSTKTRTRIAAINRALLSLSAEKPEQGKLIEHPAKPVASEQKPGRSAFGG